MRLKVFLTEWSISKFVRLLIHLHLAVPAAPLGCDTFRSPSPLTRQFPRCHSFFIIFHYTSKVRKITVLVNLKNTCFENSTVSSNRMYKLVADRVSKKEALIWRSSCSRKYSINYFVCQKQQYRKKIMDLVLESLKLKKKINRWRKTRRQFCKKCSIQ